MYKEKIKKRDFAVVFADWFLVGIAWAYLVK